MEAYPSMTSVGLIDVVSTELQWIYTCVRGARKVNIAAAAPVVKVQRLQIGFWRVWILRS